MMRVVKLVGGYCNVKRMESYKLPHSMVLEGSGKVNLGHDCLSGGSCQ
jgi:hypothetical protein